MEKLEEEEEHANGPGHLLTLRLGAHRPREYYVRKPLVTLICVARTRRHGKPAIPSLDEPTRWEKADGVLQQGSAGAIALAQTYRLGNDLPFGDLLTLLRVE